MYFFCGNHPKKKYQKERSPLTMHLLKSTASSIEDALVLNADPSNAAVNAKSLTSKNNEQ